MYIFALHTIQRDPKSKPPVVPAGSVANLEGDELDYVLGVPAARPATDDEIRAAGFADVKSEAGEAQGKPTKAAVKAAEKAAAEAAAKEAAEKDAAGGEDEPLI